MANGKKDKWRVTICLHVEQAVTESFIDEQLIKLIPKTNRGRNYN
jgi:hypothetical protein